MISSSHIKDEYINESDGTVKPDDEVQDCQPPLHFFPPLGDSKKAKIIHYVSPREFRSPPDGQFSCQGGLA